MFDVSMNKHISDYDKCLSYMVCVCVGEAAKVQIYAKINYKHVVQIGMKTDMTCAVIT